MIAGVLDAAHVTIDAGSLQALRGIRDSAAGDRCEARHRAASGCACNPRTCTSARPDAARGSRRPSPARAAAGTARAALGCTQRILVVGFRRIDVALRSARRCSRRPAPPARPRIKLGGMRDEPLHPRELVVEFRSGLRIAVRRIERADEHAVHRRLDVAALRVGWIAGQRGRVRTGSPSAGENGNAVPGFLPAPDGAVACLFDRSFGKASSVAFSSCRQTTSGFAVRSQASRLARRLLMLLMLKVAIFICETRR